jgi:hypothetical protein
MLNPYTLSEHAAAFYEARAAEGIHPTELAVLCLRNEEERNGTLSQLPKGLRTGKVGRPRKVPKTPLEHAQLATKIRMGMERRKVVPPKPPVHAETEIVFEPIRIVLSYEDCMARKAW